MCLAALSVAALPVSTLSDLYVECPFPLPCPFPEVVVWVPFTGPARRHAPRVSPWARCAFTAFGLTLIVWKGFFFECVR